MKVEAVALWSVLSFSLLPISAPAGLIYSNDFEGVIGNEWSHMSTSTTPVGDRRFLGEFNPEAITFGLNDLPPHSELTLSFDLFILRSWDGSQPGMPDIWQLSVSDGPTLINTTFSNLHLGSALGYWPQAYPNDFPGGTNPSYTGAAEICTLGYTHPSIDTDEPEDSVYQLTFTFPHLADSIVLEFSASLTEGMDPSGVWDESWGLDNVTVAVHPPAGSKPKPPPAMR